MSNTKRRTVRVFTKSVDEATREVEQIVSVFENVDLGKDRVKTGAFAASLDRWAASGDPIPTIWSHMWDDPFAHIGKVLEAKELLPGDPLLPAEIADLGGLYTRYKVDEAPFADQVFTLLKERRVREASFAYDVIREKRNADGTTDLIELDLIEVGPTLKGMNPMTQLLARKNLSATEVEFVEGVISDLRELGEEKAAELMSSNLAAARGAKSDDEPDKKAYVQLAGSLEETMDSYYRAAVDFAQTENMGNGGFYALHQEGTFPDDNRAVYCVEGWADPWGEGAYFEFRFAADADSGDLMVDSYTEVAIEATAVPKARNLKSFARLFAERAENAMLIGAKGKQKIRPKSDPSSSPADETDDEPAAGDHGLTPSSVSVEIDALDIG